MLTPVLILSGGALGMLGAMTAEWWSLPVFFAGMVTSLAGGATIAMRELSAIRRQAHRLGRMTAAALRLLELNQEFQRLDEGDALATEFAQPGWAPRTREAIASDYAEALSDFLRHAGQ